jgi:hypothetical protein
VTHTGTAVRWWSRGSDDPATAFSSLVARPGELVLTVRGQTRTLRVGTDVVRARYDDHPGLAGRLALLGPDGSTVLVLEVADWLPSLVAVSGYYRGDLTDPVEWTGVGELTAAAGLPLKRGGVSSPATVSPKQSTRPGFVVAATIGLSLSGVVWFIALVLSGVVDSQPVWSAALVAMAACAVVLFVEHQLRWARSRRRSPGDALRPRPAVPVTPSFRRHARLVLSPPGTGPIDTLVVRYPNRRQEWFDGPASRLGVQRAVVVTPAGARQPERVEFFDALGRPLVRLPWDQWFGASEQDLDLLTARGIPVNRVTGKPMAGPRDSLLIPRSQRWVLDPFDMPGAFHSLQMTPLALGASWPPVLFGAQLDSSLMVTVGILDGVLLLGPTMFRLLGLLLDRPRPPR